MWALVAGMVLGSLIMLVGVTVGAALASGKEPDVPRIYN